MSTNGYVYARGYKTANDPAWIDALLVGSNDVRGACYWTDDGDTLAVFATTADAVIVNVTETIRVGYATRSGGFTCVERLGDYLYLGTSDAGVFRLALPADGQSAHGDLTPADWTAYLSTATTPALHANQVRGMYGRYVPGNPAVCRLALATDLAEVVDLVGGTIWRDAAGFAATAVAGCGHKVYWACGNLVNARYDIAATDDYFDVTAAGTAGDDFADNQLVGWHGAETGYGAIAEQNGRLELDVTTDAEGTARQTTAVRAGYFAGDAAFAARFTVPAWPTLNTDGQYAAARLRIGFPRAAGTNWVSIERRRYRASGVDCNVVRCAANEAAPEETTVTDNTLWLRISRLDRDAVVGWRLADSGPFSAMRTYTDRPTTPVAVYLEVECNVGGHQQFAYVAELQTDWADGTAYQGLPGTALTALAANAATSDAGTSTLFAGFAAGLWGVDTDERTPRKSEAGGTVRGAYAASGGAYNVLAGTANEIRALHSADGAITTTAAAGAGTVAAGTADGLTIIDLSDDSRAFAFDTASAQPLAGDVVQMLHAAGGALVYGTATGGGWLLPDAGAPAETSLSLAASGAMSVLLGWTRPADEDWSHALLYRQTGDDDFALLRTDGFGGSGEVVRFTDADHAGRLSFYDRLADYQRYTYRVTQVDESGNESAGVTDVAYLDTPRITTLVARDPDTGSASVTGRRGVLVTVAADSGPDSGHVADAVAGVRIHEAGHPWSTVPRSSYGATLAYPLVLSAGAGEKTIEAVAYAAGGLFGETASATIYYTGADDDAAAAAPAQNLVLAHHFAGDKAKVNANNTDSRFPAANVLDDRVGVKWRSLENDATFTWLHFDLGGNHVVRYVVILGHNFDAFDKAYTGTADTWTLNLGYVAESTSQVWTDKSIRALAGDRMIVVDMQAVTACKLRLQMQFAKSGGHGAEPAYFEIGRVVIVTQNDLTQPRFNFDEAYQWGRREYAELHANPAARYAANPRRPRVATISLNDFARDQRRPWLEAFAQCGRVKPVLLILQPERLPVWSATPIDWPDAANREPSANLVLYGFFDDDRQLWSMRGLDYGSTTLTVEEAVE